VKGVGRRPVLRRVVRLFLNIFPEDVPGISREDMEETFLDGYEDARSRTRFLAVELAALFRHGLGERWESLEAPRPLAGLTDDIRFALKSLLKQPLFTAGAVLMLALGLGVNTGAFSMTMGMSRIADRFRDPEELVFLWGVEEGWDRAAVSAPHYFAWRDESTAFQSTAAYREMDRYISGDGDPQRIRTAAVTPGIFQLLGLSPEAGRLFAEADAAPDAPPVAAVSWRLWQERYGGEDSVLGTTLMLNDVAHTIVGILPKTVDFEMFWRGVGVIVPLSLSQGDTNWSAQSYRVVARLAPEATVQQAGTQIAAITQRLAQAHPEANGHLRSRVEPFQDFFFGGDNKLAMAGILMAVLAILLIACVNLAKILMAKGAARQGEVAIRLALGASRARVVRQLVTESLVLALAGGAAGVYLGQLGVELLLSTMPSAPFLLEEAGLDFTLLAYTFAVSVVAAMAFGLTPALLTSRMSLGEGVKETSPGASAGRKRKRLRDWMLVSQLAVTVPLVLTCGVSFLNLRALQSIDFGFPVEGLLTAQVDLPTHRYPDQESQSRFYRELLETLRTTPGITAVGAGIYVPIGAVGGAAYAPLVVDGREAADGSARGPRGYRAITPEYFQALGVGLLAGREFTYDDTPETLPVAVVNEAFAQTYWPDDNPVGRLIRPETDPSRLYSGYELTVTQPITVVGVVQDFGATFYGDPPGPELYLSQNQHPFSSLFVVLRSEGDPLALVPAVREGVARIDEAVPITSVRTGERMVDDWLQESRGIGAMLGVLAILALGMAVLGLYGMVAHSVAQRTFELGVRMVLGARGRAIQASVMRSFLLLAAVGVAIGIGVGALLGLVVRSFLVLLQVPWIPMVLGVSGLMMGVVALAAWVPARRATTIQPVVALKTQ